MSAIRCIIAAASVTPKATAAELLRHRDAEEPALGHGL
jgi:hypothetical protein